MKTYQGVEYSDERLTEAEFISAHPDVEMFSLWGARFVGSALTKQKYIYFDHKVGKYQIESRYR